MPLFNRKERREEEPDYSLRSLRLIVTPRVLADFKLVRAEVDQQPVLQPRRLQIAEDLRLMLRRQGLRRLQFDDQNPLDQQVRQIIPDQRAVLVIHLDRTLLPYLQSRLSQSVCQRVFIDFLQVSVPVINVYIIRRLTDLIAQRLNVFHRCLSLTAKNAESTKMGTDSAG